MKLTLPAGVHRIRIVGPGSLSEETQIVAGSTPVYVNAAWWGTRERRPISIRLTDEMPGFC